MVFQYSQVQYLEQFSCDCLPLQQARIAIAKYTCSVHISVLQVGQGDSSDNVTIVVVSVTIMTVIAKNYYRDGGHALHLTSTRLNIPITM